MKLEKKVKKFEKHKRSINDELQVEQSRQKSLYNEASTEFSAEISKL
jgi:hypothetical protein